MDSGAPCHLVVVVVSKVDGEVIGLVVLILAIEIDGENAACQFGRKGEAHLDVDGGSGVVGVVDEEGQRLGLVAASGSRTAVEIVQSAVVAEVLDSALPDLEVRGASVDVDVANKLPGHVERGSRVLVPGAVGAAEQNFVDGDVSTGGVALVVGAVADLVFQNLDLGDLKEVGGVALVHTGRQLGGVFLGPACGRERSALAPRATTTSGRVLVASRLGLVLVLARVFLCRGGQGQTGEDCGSELHFGTFSAEREMQKVSGYFRTFIVGATTNPRRGSVSFPSRSRG